MNVHAPIRIPDDEWVLVVDEAAYRDQRSDESSWTRRWGPDFNLKGVMGEWCYSQISGLPMTWRKFGDGGHDFPGVDVKGSTHYDDPFLLRLATDPFKASFYALVGVDIAKRLCRYEGWATRAELQAAEQKNHGHGLSHTLKRDALHRGLPIDSPYLAMNPTADTLMYAEKGRKMRLAEGKP